jgi:hypothetical protein
MDGYKIITELLADKPDSDMLIIKPYLYIYIPNDGAEAAKSEGISLGDNKYIDAFFGRLPSDIYSDFLKDHIPVKILVSKLFKDKDQEIKITSKNFGKHESELDQDKIESLIKKHHDKLIEMMAKKKDLDKIPSLRIQASNNIIPSFALKMIEDN